MVNLLEIYEVDMELNYRLIHEDTLKKALSSQGLTEETIKNILRLCEGQEFHAAAELLMESGCDIDKVNHYLENDALARQDYIAGIASN